MIKFYPSMTKWIVDRHVLLWLLRTMERILGYSIYVIKFYHPGGRFIVGDKCGSRKIGFRTIAAKLQTEDFDKELFPCILHWNQNHFVVLYKISGIFTGKLIFKIADPGTWFYFFIRRKVCKIMDFK